MKQTSCHCVPCYDTESYPQSPAGGSAFRVLLCSIAATLFLAGCEWLPLQTDYKYESSTLDPHVDMTAMEYLNSQPGFSILVDALDYTGLSAYYTQTEQRYTFLALNNKAMTAYMQNVFPGKTAIRECTMQTVKNMLLYHIVNGEYSAYGQLQITPMFVLTELRGENGLMTMLVRKNPWQADVGKIVVNEAGSNQKSPARSSVTSNIMPVNGVIHVFENYCYFAK